MLKKLGHFRSYSKTTSTNWSKECSGIIQQDFRYQGMWHTMTHWDIQISTNEFGKAEAHACLEAEKVDMLKGSESVCRAAKWKCILLAPNLCNNQQLAS